MKTLFEAIYARFLADNDLVGSVTDMYNTEASQTAKFPYIVFSIVNAEQDFDSSSVMEDVLLQFNVFSKKNSASEICNIYEYLKGNTVLGTGYDFYELAVDNYSTLILKRESSRILKEESVWQYNITYRCILNYTGEVAVEKFYGNLYALMQI